MPSRRKGAWDKCSKRCRSTFRVFYQVLYAQGTVLLTSNGGRESLMPVDRVGASEPTVFELARAGQNLHVILVPLDRAQGRIFLLVARSQRFQVAMLETDSSTSRLTAVAATLMALTVFAAGVLVTVNQPLRRLRDISAAAAHIEPANFTARLAVDGVPKEIAPLIESFNSALARLERGYRIQQDFLATAAHELKTPIAPMRGEIEMEGPANRTTLLKDLDHMSRQVHQSPRVRILVAPIEPRTRGAAMKDGSGSIRTGIQGQSGSEVAAAGERCGGGSGTRRRYCGEDVGAMARGCAVQARPRAGLDCGRPA